MDKELKQKMDDAIWYARQLFIHNIITGTTGNISFLYRNNMYITKSGSCLGRLDYDSFAITDLQGHIFLNKPSKEYPMHLALYNINKNNKAIIHTHSFYTTLLTYQNDKQINTAYMNLKKEQLKHIDYFNPGSNELFDAINREIKNSINTYILDKHGIITAKNTLKSAFSTIEEIEYASKLTFLLTNKA